MSKTISSLNKIGISTNGLNKNDILNFGKIPEDKLNAYIQEIQSIKQADYGDFEPLQIQEYANALSDLDSTQTALLLKTQGLTNAQIQQTLAAQGASTAAQYQAMVEAGLLESSTKLTNTKLQSVLATQLESEAKAEEVMTSMGLTVAKEGEEVQTVKLTAKKLEQAVASGVLTEAQAQELAMTLGVTAAQTSQASSAMPKWIAQMKAMAAATWAQAKATGAWLITNPAGWLILGASAAAIAVHAIKKHKQAQEEAFESAKKNAEDAKSNIKSLQSEIKQNADTVDQAGKKYAELAQGVNQLTGKNISLSDDEYKEFLDVSNQLADVFPQLTKGYDDNGNAILDLQGNVDGITGKLKDLLEIEQQLAQQEINKNIDTYFENQSKVFGKEAKTNNSTIDAKTKDIEKYRKSLSQFNSMVEKNDANFQSELDRQTYYADFLADMEKANIDIADAIISQDGTSATEYNFAKLSKETQEQIRQYYAGIISTANTEMQSAKATLSTSNAEFASYVNMWMQNSSGSYLAMTGNDEMQSALSSIVSGLNWGDILQGDDFSGLSGEELESAIETNILVPLQSAMANADTGDQFKQIITDALTISDDDISLEESKNRIEAYVQEINDVLGDALGKPLTASDLGMQKYLDNYEMLMDGVSANASKFVSTTDKEFSDAKRNLEGEYQKISDWGLDEYANNIKDKTIQTKFGNVDMDKRTIIHWSNELKKTYADALASWDYDPEIGSIDTVYGMSDRFGENLNGTGWEVAFTPILPDGTFLSKDTVYQYINSIIDKAYDNDHQITHSELKDLDKQGMKIGDTFVHGIYAAFDKNTNYDNNSNWADVVGRLMHFSGQDGAIQLAENAMASMTTLDKSKESLMNFAKENSINTEAEIQTWNRIMSESETREEAMQRYLNQSAITSYDSSFDPSTAYEAMNNALSEQSSQGYLTEETLNGLKTAYGDLSKVITYTSSGIQLNTEYMANYTEQTAKAALIANQLKEANAVDQYNKEISALKKIISTQVKNTNVRTKLNKAYAKGVDALKDEIKNLGKDNDGWSDSLSTHLDNISALQDEINGYDALEQSIMATLSSLNQYKKALETPDQNDNFLYAQSQIESMQDAYDKGWTQTDQFKEWMNYIGTFNEQLEYSDEEIQQYMARTKRYMTDDISGLYNYLDDASKLSDQIIKNVDGSYDIQVQNIGKLAEQMNMSVSQTMDILMSMSNADGFNITFDNLSDSIEKNLNEISGVNAEARQQIEESREEIEALKKAGYDTSELEDLYNSVIQEHAGDVPEISLYAHLSSLSLDDLEKEAQDAADVISKDTSINIDVDLNPKSAKEAQNQIDQLVAKRDNFDVGSEQWNNIQTVLTDLLVKKQELEQPTIMKLDLTDVQDSYQQTVAILQQYIEAKNALESAQTLGIDTTDAESKLSSITEKLQSLESDGKLKTIGIDAEINTDEFYKQIEALNTDKLKKDNAKISVDANTTPYERAKNTLIQDTNKETASIKIKANTTNFYTNLQQQLQTHVFTVNVKGQITGVSGGTVTSHGNSRSKAIKNGVIMGNPRKKTSKSKASAAGTTAYVDGIRNGQIAYDQQALVGEVAPELLVRNGEAQLIGQRGAEFKNLKKGDVIFNHIDTAKLLSGDDGVRGKLIGGSFANGTTISNAYATSTQRATGSAPANTRFHGSSGSGSHSNGSNGSNSSSAQDKADEFLETIDWIEVKINRCEEAIARLNKTEENTFSGWTLRTTALNDEIAKTADEIEWATQGYKRYLQQANSVALSEDYKRKVRNGEINIEDITDEDLYNRVQDYQNWYEKAVELQDKIQELNISLSELAQKKFDNIVTQFEDMEKVFTDTNDILDKLVDYAETKGRIISKSYYEAMLQNENENNKLLVQQRDQMVSELNELVNTGKVTEYSETWYDLKQQIDEVNGSIVESNKSIQEFYNNIRQADWDLFDLVQDKITGIADEIEFVQSLLEDRDNLTDGHLNRGLTNEGLAQLGNYASKYNIYMSQAEKYANEIKKIEADIAKDPANKDLIDRKEELIKAQRDVILSANDEKKSMIDLARDGYDAMLEVLQELIDKRKEYLDNKKSIYEYQNTISEKTENLVSLRKQLSVFENDNSEESLKKVQQLQSDIKDAEKDLKDTEYDKYIEDQEKMLDDLYQEYSDKIDEKFEQTEILIQELIGVVNDNQGAISEVINTATSDVGYTISDQMKTIWSDVGTVISGFSGKFDTYATTVQSAINSIQITIDKMLQIAQAEANKNIATANNPNGVANGSSSTAPKPQATPKANNNSSTAQAPKASPNVGTRVNATGNWYYDSYGTAPTGNVNRFKPDYFEIDKIVNGRAYPYHIQAIIRGKRAGGNGWVKGNQIGYKNGLKEATYDHLAWTQEEGAEIIRRSDGSILTPITRGTTVFTREMTDNLWNIAKQNPEKFYQNAMPTMNTFATTNRGGDVSVSIGDIKLDGIQNPDQFAQALIGVVKDYSKVQKVLQAATVDLVAGKSIKDINRF